MHGGRAPAAERRGGGAVIMGRSAGAGLLVPPARLAAALR